VRNIVAALLLILSLPLHAQLLPDNSSLNAQSVQRWMQTNRDIAPIMQVVDGLNTTEAELKTFEALSPQEQDQKIDALLKANNLQESADQILIRYGWKSVGEYMRLSSKLGNAIAAYFLLGDLGKLNEEQAQQLKEKADPTILAVPQSDIDFIKRNEKALQQYIQAYGRG
jgi:hypothetical protein